MSADKRADGSPDPAHLGEHSVEILIEVGFGRVDAAEGLHDAAENQEIDQGDAEEEEGGDGGSEDVPDAFKPVKAGLDARGGDGDGQ